MAGRKPKPSHLKLVAGNPGKRTLNPSEAQVTPGIPRPPNSLKEKPRAIWHEWAPRLHKMGVLSIEDEVAFRALCESMDDYHRIKKIVDGMSDDDLFYDTTTQGGATMTRQHPALSALHEADRRLRAWLSEFGMTPSARSRVTARKPAEDDPADKYLNRA